jgi:ABC-type uncharacterized transport system substrate-binding protein
MSTRREFIALLGGAAAGWPLAAHAQQAERMRRVGVLSSQSERDPEYQARYTAFRQTLQQLGWTEGRNVRFDYRWDSIGTSELLRRHAAELVAQTDIILVSGSQNVATLQQTSRTVPIVFVGVVDPVSAGFVESFTRPAGNITGFTPFEYGFSAKWLELLKQIDPRVTRAAVMRDHGNPAGIGLMAAMQSVAPSLGVELSPIGVHDASEIERAIASFARGPNGGLIATLNGFTIRHRVLIITLAARHGLPAVHPTRDFAAAGGLVSYGPDTIDQFRSAAGYVDRILKGEKPADLPVQAPTKYELVINLKTAKTLGIEVPTSVLARADEVIE